MNGKGSRARNNHGRAWRVGYDAIDWCTPRDKQLRKAVRAAEALMNRLLKEDHAKKFIADHPREHAADVLMDVFGLHRKPLK